MNVILNDEASNPIKATNPLPVTDSTAQTLIGEVQATPTANTVLGRLKALLTGIVLAAGTNLIGKVGIDQTTDGGTNKVAAHGMAAHDAAASGNPVRLGGVYRVADPAVADGDIADIRVNAKGELITTFSGSNMDLRGTAATKPLATAVTIGATYWSVDTDPNADVIEVSNGTNWVVI